MIIDGDTGGPADHFVFMVRTLERLGVSAVIIEDKVFPKQNSLLKEASHVQEDPERFCQKIEAGRGARVTDDFMVIARIESLIAGQPISDALFRAKKYISAGADGIMIHSKRKDPNEVLEFCKQYNRFDYIVPLVVVPTSYNMITEDELTEAGVKVVIYANHLLRGSYGIMTRVAETILSKGRAGEADELCSPVKDIFGVVGK